MMVNVMVTVSMVGLVRIVIDDGEDNGDIEDGGVGEECVG